MDLDRADALKDEGKYEEAVRAYDEVLRDNPNNDAAHFNKALALQNLGRLEEAIASYNKDLELDPGDADAYRNKGNVLRDQGKNDEAISSYNEALRLKPDYADAYIIKGLALADQGKYEEAIRSYNEALRLKPDYAGPYNNKGNALANQGKYEEAIKCFNEALRLKPDFAFAYNNKGAALRDQAKNEEAIVCYNEVLRLKPDYVAYFGKATALVVQGKYDEAIKNYNEALRLNPDDADPFVNKGNALAGQGKNEEAIRSYNEALRLKPDLAEAYYNKGNALAGQGKNEDAIRSYNEALRLKPDNADAYLCKGNALKNQGKTEEAIRNYNEALRLKPDNAYAYNGKGNALKDQEKNEEAIRNYNEALRLRPDYADAYICKGNALKNQGKTEEALENYEKALKINSGNDPLHQINKGVVLNELGRMREAADAFEKANNLVQRGVFGSHIGQGNKDYINQVLNEDRKKLLEKLTQYTKLESTSTRRLSLEDRNKEKQIVSKVGDVFNDRIKGTEKGKDAQVMELTRELEQHKQKLLNLERNKAERAEVSHAIKHNPYKEEADNERVSINSQPKLKEYYETFCQVFNQNFAGCMAQVSGKVKASSTSIPLDDLKKVIPVPLIGDVIGSLGFLAAGALQIKDTRKANNLVSLAKGSSEMEELIELLARKNCFAKKPMIEGANSHIHRLKEIKSKILNQGYNTPAKQLALKEASMLLVKCMSGEVDKEQKITPQMVKILGAPNDLVEDLEITEGAIYGEIETRKIEPDESDNGFNKYEDNNSVYPNNKMEINPLRFVNNAQATTDYLQKIREIEEREKQREEEVARLREQLANNQGKGGCCTVMQLNEIKYDNELIEKAMKTGDFALLREALEQISRQETAPGAGAERSDVAESSTSAYSSFLECLASQVKNEPVNLISETNHANGRDHTQPAIDVDEKEVAYHTEAEPNQLLGEEGAFEISVYGEES